MLFARKPRERLVLNKEGERRIREIKPVPDQRVFFEKKAMKLQVKSNADPK